MSERLPTVLCYHRVASPAVERTDVSPAHFREQLGALLDAGWRFVPLSELLAAVTTPSERRLRAPLLALTFDDAYEDLAAAWPWLRERQIPATCFVITGAVGGDNLWNPRARVVARHLGLDQLRAMKTEGLDVQLHGLDHHRLTKFAPEELDRRFTAARQWLADELDAPPTVVAYPYGDHDAKVVEVARRHFEYGLSVTQGRWAGPDARHVLNRLEVTGWMTPADLAALLEAPLKQRAAIYHAARQRAGA